MVGRGETVCANTHIRDQNWLIRICFHVCKLPLLLILLSSLFYSGYIIIVTFSSWHSLHILLLMFHGQAFINISHLILRILLFFFLPLPHIAGKLGVIFVFHQFERGLVVIPPLFEHNFCGSNVYIFLGFFFCVLQ